VPRSEPSSQCGEPFSRLKPSTVQQPFAIVSPLHLLTAICLHWLRLRLQAVFCRGWASAAAAAAAASWWLFAALAAAAAAFQQLHLRAFAASPQLPSLQLANSASRCGGCVGGICCCLCCGSFRRRRLSAAAAFGGGFAAAAYSICGSRAVSDAASVYSIYCTCPRHQAASPACLSSLFP